MSTTTHHPEVHPVYTTADVGRVITAEQLARCATAQGAPEDVDPIPWMQERSPGVILYPAGNGSITIHRAATTRFTRMGWVA